RHQLGDRCDWHDRVGVLCIEQLTFADLDDQGRGRAQLELTLACGYALIRLGEFQPGGRGRLGQGDGVGEILGWRQRLRLRQVGDEDRIDGLCPQQRGRYEREGQN